jgi:hypothetical protein
VLLEISITRDLAGHVWGRGEVHTGFEWGNLREGDHLEDRGVDGRVVLKWIFERLGGWGGGMD